MNEAISKYVPRVEGQSREFTYYEQSLDGYSLIWDLMVDKLRRMRMGKPVSGFIYPDGIVYWSIEAPSHEKLEASIGRIEGAAGSFQCRVNGEGLLMQIRTEDLSIRERFTDYLRRSITNFEGIEIRQLEGLRN